MPESPTVSADGAAGVRGDPRGRWLFLTDVPPYRGASGCHFVAANLCTALSQGPNVVLTRAFSRKLKLEQIIAACDGTPVELWTDCTQLGLRQLHPSIRGMADTFVFKLQVRLLARRLRKYRPTRIFALAGDNPYFLEIAVALAESTKLPLDLFLVDDLEASALSRGDGVAVRWIRSNESRLLRKCSSVWAISKGYSEHLMSKHGLEAKFLPVPMMPEKATYRQQSLDSVKRFTFVGSTNHLYLDSLVSFYQSIDHLNAETPGAPYRLTVLTLHDPKHLKEQIGDPRYLEVVLGASDAELRRRQSEAHAVLLPYSFKASERLMVSTSFSCKTAAALTAGRPILVFGPAYASVPRHFLKHELPLVVTSPALLREGILAIPTHDHSETIRKYNDLAQSLHAPTAVIARLEGRTVER